MCLISDHRNDLQYGSVLCHQEQQGGYIDGELTPSPLPPPPTPTSQPASPLYAHQSLHNQPSCIRRETPKLHCNVISRSPERSGGEVHGTSQRESTVHPSRPRCPSRPRAKFNMTRWIVHRHTFSSTPPALKIYFPVPFHNARSAFGTTLWHSSVLTYFRFIAGAPQRRQCRTVATTQYTKPELWRGNVVTEYCCKYGHLFSAPAVNIIYRALSSCFYVIYRPYANHALCA